MRDTIAGKAARYSLAQDCGKCANCLDAAARKETYLLLLAQRVAESIPKAEIDAARLSWLHARRCTYNELKDLAQKVGRSDRQKEVK